MVKDLRVEIDGEEYEVDSRKEAAELAEEKASSDSREEIVTIHIQYENDEWVATPGDPNLEYEGRDDRKWGAIRELVELVDDRARRFGF